MSRASARVEAALRDADRAMLKLISAIDPADLSSHYELAGRRGHGRPSAQDIFDLFIGQEKRRYIKAVNVITSVQPTGRICDWGCFLPYLPVALSALEYEVSALDNYSLFGPSFKAAVLETASATQFSVVDLDMLTDEVTQLGTFDFAILMAVVEHLHGSPRHLLENVRNTLDREGSLLFEVPNMVELSKRIAVLLGRSPLPDYRQYFHSDYPFRGHNREMTLAEVAYLLHQTGFSIQSTWCYDYWSPSRTQWLAWAFAKVKPVLPVPQKGQSIMVLANPRVAGS